MPPSPPILNRVKIKEKITEKAGENATKNVEIMVLLKSNLGLNWYKNCVLVANNADQTRAILITDTKLDVPL